MHTKDKDENRKPVPLWQLILLGRHPQLTAVRIVFLALAAFIVFKFIFLPIRVTGASMEPTYRDGSVNLVSAIPFCFRKPKRGEVVAIAMAGRHVMLLKRIVGLPGERISFNGGVLYINGQRFVEPYLKTPCNWNMPAVTAGPDEYFVVGDNRGMPMEMHYFGRVNRKKIVGNILL